MDERKPFEVGQIYRGPWGGIIEITKVSKRWITYSKGKADSGGISFNDHPDFLRTLLTNQGYKLEQPSAG